MTTFDAIIIGAGISGSSTALQLARQGLKVALIEKDHVGAGSTGKSSAIIRQHYSNLTTAKMALHSLRVFQNFADAVGGDAGFTETGFMALVKEKDRAGLEANVALQQRVGIKTEIISPAEIVAMVPGLKIKDVACAAYEPEGGYASPYETVNSYANAAKQAGATLMVNTKVTGIHFDGQKVRGVETTAGRFYAPLVLNSAGPWGAEVARMAGLNVPIDPCRVQVSFFQRPAAYAQPHPVVADFIEATYFRSETGALTLVGLVDPEEANNIVNPDDFNQRVDFDFVLETGERLTKRYPALAESKSTGGDAALYAITPDWHPIIDEVPAGSGNFICAGFSGHGFKLGPAVGLLTAQLMTGVTEPTFNTKMFRLSRYAENDPVRGQYEYSIAG